MAENLKKTLLIDGTEYNINAVYSDEAGKVTNPLLVRESGKSVFRFDGQSFSEIDSDTTTDTYGKTIQQVIDYVPADEGGTFSGPVKLNHETSTVGSIPADDEVITSAQVSNRVADLNGAPLCIWNTSLVIDDISKSLYASKNNTNDKLHKFTTIVGTESDFYILKSLLAGNGTGSSEINYTLSNTMSPLIAHWIASSLDSSASGAIVVPSTYTGTSGGSTYTKDVKEVQAIFRENTKITTAVLPKSITKINGQTFQGCTGLLSIVIPDNVTDLSSNSIFDGCTSLNHAVLSENITTIGVNTFRNCTSLTEITIPKKVTTINGSAFKGCSKLTSIVIPKSLKTVAEYAFDGCDSLETIYYEGNATDWSLINIQGYNGLFASAKKVYNYVVPTPVVPGTAIDIYEISKGPFIYICRDVESATLPASNKMFLRLPESDDIVEISKGATRLNSTNSIGQDYYTYEGLAEIIAKINNRLDGLGVKVSNENVALATVHSVSSINNLVPEVEVTDDFDPESVPTIEELTKAVVKLEGSGWDDKNTATDNLNTVLSTTDSIKALRDDLTDLAKEVVYDLGGAADGLGTAIDYANTRIDKAEDTLANHNTRIEALEETDTLMNLKNGYVTKAVGGIAKDKTLASQVTDLEDLIKKLLGIQDGRAPYGLTVTLYKSDGSVLESTITAALNATDITEVSARWSLNAGTYTGTYAPSITGTNASVPSLSEDIAATSGTINGITIKLAGSHTSAKVAYRVDYSTFGEVPGSYLEASDSITINRNCYYGPDGGTLSISARASVNNWNVTHDTLNNKQFVIMYPKAWGALKSITDNDTGYEALGDTFNKIDPNNLKSGDTVTKNGGTYYVYKTHKPQNAKMNFTLKL